MLRLERLVIELGAFRLAADVTVETGRIVALLGPSGAGKSTLLDVIAGFLPPNSGRVLWEGVDLGPLPPGARPVSMLFQDNNLFPHLTAAQNVGLGLHPDLRLSPADRDRAEAALARVGLAGLGPRKPAALSGGQRGRVALARMLLRGRPLMLLDEPFAALGPALKAEMLGLVAELAHESGATVLMVTHDPADARAIADETMLVAEGRADPPRPTAALFADPPEALRAYLG
ncbi:ATP-binding cassette domain-containing protein [Rhodovulum euryhalinum]|uniref:Thiamine transport system ATP-binding protein n=1 Tax=Rhodovulum euryhalinum TaxID=35805 RepID=A0A4R2KT81_9RHOB|nr:ATP-binding cassette domain-containing protein [Rhodovulum euryhalinum]TCO69895.1 thiamine transport system ATP-binding protein [Rhodovulum euryhalinum]